MERIVDHAVFSSTAMAGGGFLAECAGFLMSKTRDHGFVAQLERRFLLQELLKQDINILFDLGINCISDGVIGGRKRGEELLEHLFLA